MRGRARRPGTGGFTLLEMTVALVVTGLAVAAGYAGLRTLSDARAASRDVHAGVVRAANVRATLESWIQGLDSVLAVRPRSDGALPLDRVVFVTADGGELRPGPRRIRLRIDRDPATAVRGLVADVWPAGPSGGERESLEMAPEAVGLELRYRVERGRGHRWVDRFDPGTRTPDAVRIRLVESARIRLGPGTGAGREGGLPALLRRPLVSGVARARW